MEHPDSPAYSIICLQSSFFASFMCFEVLPLSPLGAGGDDEEREDEDDISAMEMDGSDVRPCE